MLQLTKILKILHIQRFEIVVVADPIEAETLVCTMMWLLKSRLEIVHQQKNSGSSDMIKALDCALLSNQRRVIQNSAP